MPQGWRERDFRLKDSGSLTYLGKDRVVGGKVVSRQRLVCDLNECVAITRRSFGPALEHAMSLELMDGKSSTYISLAAQTEVVPLFHVEASHWCCVCIGEL